MYFFTISAATTPITPSFHFSDLAISTLYFFILFLYSAFSSISDRIFFWIFCLFMFNSPSSSSILSNLFEDNVCSVYFACLSISRSSPFSACSMRPAALSLGAIINPMSYAEIFDFSWMILLTIFNRPGFFEFLIIFKPAFTITLFSPVSGIRSATVDTAAISIISLRYCLEKLFFLSSSRFFRIACMTLNVTPAALRNLYG
ncbi:MAG: hypothetical protein BWY60_00289 [Actinobacteria bacterium ADurb.Bin346]|nr:MAG: hypothetical protein BWY60_00289 [Actinobacteria bacterium ADurb.Bin346]